MQDNERQVMENISYKTKTSHKLPFYKQTVQKHFRLR